ncbi:MAG: Flp pilus assembly complex ATPase component TadA [Planctomycetaceae bacterium]|nr:Flp pilus assembly complex ATPase component TadA [Planctomycetales bacterium]MCB9874909.1 Flp pilus assembly complex ATPase component TadA [Planctomycetaceae bacterium]MCB9923763.1 Flp pilus assembly complex ATPase component TadA [Planctomycetaceae bacterium]
MEAGEILLGCGLLDDRQLSMSRVQNQDDVVEAAVELGFVTEEAALRALGDAVGLDYVDLSETQVDLSLLNSFPNKLIHRQSVFPISRQNGSLVVATSDPFDLYPLDEVSAATGLSVTPVLASRSEITKLIKRHLGVGSETVEGLMLATAEDEGIELLSDIETDGSELSEMAQEASVVRLVNEILLEAIESRASDVHIETQPSGLKIRYRIDGMLQTQPVPAEINRFALAIVSRLKIMSRLNIAEKRLPQDGRMKLRISGREVDVRLSVIPMIHGEGLVMRLLDKSAMSFDLKKLGMEEETYRTFRELIDIPHGIILVTGPTGSGKTTTLYSSLIEINSPDIKIITTEDPVEYQLEGINQIQVHPKIGLTFAHSLRSILRHDPDVVLVGEIRDLETAENAIQASLTGHLVFSTLHTNDAASAYTRMVEMGVEPFLVASTVEAVMAQRLIRRLCPKCKEAYEPDLADLPPDFPFDQLDGPLHINVGCRECRGTGYAGRLGIYELLVTTDEVRQLAHDRASSWKLKQAAVHAGMLTLRDDGWRKVLAGSSTVDEVLRVTKGDQQVAKA